MAKRTPPPKKQGGTRVLCGPAFRFDVIFVDLNINFFEHHGYKVGVADFVFVAKFGDSVKRVGHPQNGKKRVLAPKCNLPYEVWWVVFAPTKRKDAGAVAVHCIVLSPTEHANATNPRRCGPLFSHPQSIYNIRV